MTTKTKNPEKAFRENENRLLSSEERVILSQISPKEPPHGSRALALLAIDEGATQAEAGIQAGLTKGQVRYWLDKFRKDRTVIFPEELLNQAQPEDAESPPNPVEAQQELPDAEETTGPVGEAAAQQEATPKAKKKPKKKSKKKSKKVRKSKKRKKPKQAEKKRKGKKSKKKGSKKAKGTKGKSSNKPKKKSKK